MNRGSLRADIFKKEADYAAFECILHEGLAIHDVELYGYQLMSSHYHLVLRPLVETQMGSVTDKAYLIEAEAMTILQQYFQATGGDGLP